MNIFKKLRKGKEGRRRGNKRERKREGDEVGVMCFREVLLLVFIIQEQLYNVDPPLASMAYKTRLVGRLAGSSLLGIALGRQAIEIDDVRPLPGGTIKCP